MSFRRLRQEDCHGLKDSEDYRVRHSLSTLHPHQKKALIPPFDRNRRLKKDKYTFI